MKNTMDKKNNPFKVPENYFEELNKRLETEAKRKHVSVSKVLKYVASVSMILILSTSVFVIGFNNDKKESLLSSNFFSLFVSQDSESQKQSKQIESEQLAWEKHVDELINEAEEIKFTEEELEYLENFMEEDISEYVYNNLENIE